MFILLSLNIIFLPLNLGGEEIKKYSNPVLEKSMPDPTVVSDGDDNFYLYATNASKKTPVYHSSDLVNWNYCSDCFTTDQLPT